MTNWNQLKHNESPNDLLLLINAIGEITGLHILNRNLDYFYSYLSGYRQSLILNKIEIQNDNILNDFTDYLKEELKYEEENTFGWFGILRELYGSDKSGFLKFFEYFNKFKTAKGY